ncbi:MAG: RagB/SusD family nutrient uptake outer membrane protein, partial [Bacteroidales bacterium]|nr:RagB/SusD family nutrient uptake outer membrane protein [Bacteroidales bacterium]
MKKTIYILLGVLSFGLLSCNDFLDEVPDNRTEIKTKDDVKNLLVSAYPNATYFYICEMASDNTDESEGSAWEFDVLQREAFSWGKITDVFWDSPHFIWEECYTAIAAANVAIEFIENSDNPESLNAQLGEALLCRAYSHFILVNLFSKHFSSTSDTDLGIPYITQPETTVNPPRERGTVAKVYENILADLTKGLPLIDNNSYVIPKYRFNKEAVYAFAARIYLYLGEMDEVIEYANKVLGTGVPSKLRDWAYSGSLGVNYDFQPNEYIEVDNPATLLNISALSSWGYIGGPYSLGRRYTHTEMISATETMETLTPWGNMGDPGFVNQGVFTNPDVNKVICRKIAGYFKSHDPIAGTGERYNINVPFTTDELLLCRAEAYIR